MIKLQETPNSNPYATIAVTMHKSGTTRSQFLNCNIRMQFTD